MAKKYRLLARSPTLEDIEKCINEFYFSENYEVSEDGVVRNKKTGKVLDDVRVIEKKGRFRFEMEVSE